MESKKREVSRTTAVVLIIVLVTIIAGGLALSISLSDSATSTTTQGNSLRLEGFSLNLSNSNLSGTLMMSSRSSLARMDLYINGTFMGSMNYTTGMAYSSGYTMMFSTNPSSMPIMSRLTTASGKDYNVTMIAHFSDGTSCRGSAIIVAGSGGMMDTTSRGMIASETTNMIGSETTNMMSSAMMTTSEGMMSSTTDRMMTTTTMMNSETTGMMSSESMMSSHASTSTRSMMMNTTSHMMG